MTRLFMDATIEEALAELVDKIVPGLDSGDLLADAKTASKALDEILITSKTPIPEGQQPYPPTPASDVQSGCGTEDSYSHATVKAQSWAPAGPLQIEYDPERYGKSPWHITDGHHHAVGATPNEALNGFASYLTAQVPKDDFSGVRPPMRHIAGVNVGVLERAARAQAWATGSPRDWTEDAGHENGNYQCKCTDCGEFFIGHKRRVVCKMCDQAPKDDALTIADYEEVLADHRRLVRELDVLLNGDGAAQQSSLCDIVSQLRRERIKAQAPTANAEPKYCGYPNCWSTGGRCTGPCAAGPFAVAPASAANEDAFYATLYRWLRANYSTVYQWGSLVWYPYDGKTPERLDAAIVAAIKHTSGNGE